MPTAEAILEGASGIANEWRGAAMWWHAFLGVIVLAASMRVLSVRRVGFLLSLLPLSVSALAWNAANPFTGVIFLVIGMALAAIARTLPATPARLASPPALVAGAVLLAFGWVYPHFLDTETWTAYLVAAPLGLLPCPTLTALIGVTMLLGLSRSRSWSGVLIAAALLYGLIGIFVLDVMLDAALLAGAGVLAVTSHRRFRENRGGAGAPPQWSVSTFASRNRLAMLRLLRQPRP